MLELGTAVVGDGDVDIDERYACAAHQARLIELTLAAIEQAFLRGARQLASQDFARAYHLRTACDDAFNPFIIPDYYRIDARQIFSREKR